MEFEKMKDRGFIWWLMWIWHSWAWFVGIYYALIGFFTTIAIYGVIINYSIEKAVIPGIVVGILFFFIGVICDLFRKNW